MTLKLRSSLHCEGNDDVWPRIESYLSRDDVTAGEQRSAWIKWISPTISGERVRHIIPRRTEFSFGSSKIWDLKTGGSFEAFKIAKVKVNVRLAYRSDCSTLKYIYKHLLGTVFFTLSPAVYTVLNVSGAFKTSALEVTEPTGFFFFFFFPLRHKIRKIWKQI